MDASWCLIGLIALIGIVLLGRIILKIAMWIIIIIIVLLLVGGGVSLLFHLFGNIGGLGGVIYPIIGAF